MATTVYDIVVVGAGPVGLSLGRMLGLQGHKVLILERWPHAYPLPRAVHFDDEIGRLFQSMQLSDQVKAISEGVPDFYEWRNAAGESLVRIDWSGNGPSGWPTASFFSQPDLEKVLAGAVAAMDNVSLVRGAEVVGITDTDDCATVTAARAGGEQWDVKGRFVIGCDGTNSFVRECMGAAMHDDGFYFDWLIVDTVPLEQRDWTPQNWQLCDPARPTTVVSGGPGRRRWEFMRLPDESREELDTTEKAWELLGAWDRTPDNTELERHAVYTFAARWADSWHRGRLLIAGDAAHQMPPFAGQGMCSGLRDAANLSWKLDRILRGESELALLDSYTSERVTHLQHAIAMSVELGKVICVLDEQLAKERDARMIAGGADPRTVLPVSVAPVLGDGVVGGSDNNLRGTLLPQYSVRLNGQEKLLDDAAGPGAVLLLHDDGLGDELHCLSPKLLEATGIRVMTIGKSDAAPDLVDINGQWTQWFCDHGAVGALVRPDHYIFDAVFSIESVPQIITSYKRKLYTSEAIEFDR